MDPVWTFDAQTAKKPLTAHLHRWEMSDTMISGYAEGEASCQAALSALPPAVRAAAARHEAKQRWLWHWTGRWGILGVWAAWGDGC